PRLDCLVLWIDGAAVAIPPNVGPIIGQPRGIDPHAPTHRGEGELELIAGFRDHQILLLEPYALASEGFDILSEPRFTRRQHRHVTAAEERGAPKPSRLTREEGARVNEVSISQSTDHPVT